MAAVSPSTSSLSDSIPPCTNPTSNSSTNVNTNTTNNNNNNTTITPPTNNSNSTTAATRRATSTDRDNRRETNKFRFSTSTNFAVPQNFDEPADNSTATLVPSFPSSSATATASGFRPQHTSNPSISAITGSTNYSKQQRSGSLLALASAAIDRTFSSAEQKIRPRQSAGRLSISEAPTRPGSTAQLDRLPSNVSIAPSSQADTSYETISTPSIRTVTSNEDFTKNYPSAPLPVHLVSSPLSSSGTELSGLTPVQTPQPVFGRPYDQTDPNHPLPIRLPRLNNKMHQTSSRLLRMTDDDRPFTKDFKDLFATLIVSLLPLSAHRVRLTKVEHTFLSEDAINNLGSLKFSQSNRMPDPKDPSRIVTTTTTTTFSMAKDMARSICQRFVEARLIESADGKYQQTYTMKGVVWQLTAKGISILDRFCARNGIQQQQVAQLIGNSPSQLVVLERDTQTDKIFSDRGSIEVIFRRFVGVNGPNIKSSASAADSDSLNEYRDGLTGVKMASERRVQGRVLRDSFTGKGACDWLMDCCTTVDRREAIDIASLFVKYGLVDPAQPATASVQPSKTSYYQLSAKGRELLNAGGSRGRSSESDTGIAPRSGVARDSNTQRLDKILNDAALRLLFRENLRETHCEENLSFYLDVDDFVRNCRQSIRSVQKNPGVAAMDGIKEIMAQAYGIYNAFLAPGSPCELNIDHQLRNNLATRMTKAVGQDSAMVETLKEVTALFEDAQNAVFKLMASDSVPKFLRHPKYEHTLRNYDFDAIIVRAPERSDSRAAPK